MRKYILSIAFTIISSPTIAKEINIDHKFRNFIDNEMISYSNIYSQIIKYTISNNKAKIWELSNKISSNLIYPKTIKMEDTLGDGYIKLDKKLKKQFTELKKLSKSNNFDASAIKQLRKIRNTCMECHAKYYIKEVELKI